MDTTWIAEEKVVFLHANGRRVTGRIAVGMPVQIDETEARCTVALDGLDRIQIRVGGTSTVQALLLGVRHLGMRLHDFRSKGGRVLDPRDDSDALDGTFGPLLQPAVVDDSAME
jgi:hypothetical protein